MALLNWLNSKLKGNDDTNLVIDPEEETLSGLNLKDALDVHNAWKTKLEKELSGNSMVPIDATQAAYDNLCALGKWLYGPGKKLYSHLPEYEIAKKAHEEFHMAAAEVVVEHQSGNISNALFLMKNKFRSVSNNNKHKLVSLFVAARK